MRNHSKVISNGISAVPPDKNINEKTKPLSEEMLLHKNGVVYTPEKLARYLAQKTAQYMHEDPTFQDSRQISVIDNAVGDGELLKAMVVELQNNSQLERLVLCGVDIDRKALEISRQRLEQLNGITNLVLVNTNSLCPYDGELLQGWKRIFKEASITDGFDCLIDNPPWGADLSEYQNKINQEYFTVMQGQFDSYELFIQLALHVVRNGGYFSFIIPDSILNHGKSVVRKLLLESTEIRFIARLGEKIFPKINRACTLIICKNTLPLETNLVDCFRLTKKDRGMILKGYMDFSEAELKSVHKVPQKRFVNNQYNQFDIDLRENEVAVLQKIQKGTGSLSDELISHRGVELSSSGWVCRCPNCSMWAPLSKAFSVKCKKCGKTYNSQLAEKTTIVFSEPVPNSVKLITGSDLKRYIGIPSKWIKIDKKGINYKPKSYYEGPKILVRKTGVGLTAILDYSSAYTTQVVYILRKKTETSPDLEFFIALINSRAYYFYLAKSFGELEWRSHPYLTQSQILSLPLPNLKIEKNKKNAEKIVSLLKPVLKEGELSAEIDLEVELLVGKLFSLTKNDYKVIFSVIDESEELLPIMALKSISLEEF